MLSEPETYLKPRLMGSRFDRHTIPLDVLSDIAALKDLFVAVAKWSYLKSNTSRKRAPRGFENKISLEMKGIGEGSAMVDIVLATTTAAAALWPNDIHQSFIDARDIVCRAVEAANDGKDVSSILPPKLVPYFEPIGRSLKDGESIELIPKVTMTKETRRKLIESGGSQAITDETVIVGRIPEIDQADDTFEIELFDSRKVVAPLQKQDLELLNEAFLGYSSGSKVRLNGIGRFKGKRLERMVSVDGVVIVESLDVRARLDDLKLLKEGWMAGQGSPLVVDQLDWLASGFEEYFGEEYPLPYLYPTIDGGVRAEWMIGSTDISLEIDISKKTGSWHALNLDKGDDSEFEIYLQGPDGWIKIMELLQAAGALDT